MVSVVVLNGFFHWRFQFRGQRYESAIGYRDAWEANTHGNNYHFTRASARSEQMHKPKGNAGGKR